MKVIAVMAWLLFSSGVRADLIKCVSSTGQVTYQSEPCQDAAKQTPLRTQPGPSGRDALRNEGPVTPELVSEILIYYDMCVRGLPEFRARYGATMERWRNTHLPIVAKVESDPKFAEKLRTSRDRAAQRQPSSRDVDSVESMCVEMVVPILGGDADSGASSPQQAWTGFHSSLRAGDSRRALSFLSTEIRDNYRKLFAQMTPEQMRSMADRITKFQVTNLIGDNLATGVAANNKGDGGEILFIRSKATGKWLISSM